MAGGLARSAVPGGGEVKNNVITAIAMFCLGAVGGAIIMSIVLHDRSVELSQRELVLRGFAYYTNGPSGFPVFKMKESKP